MNTYNIGFDIRFLIFFCILKLLYSLVYGALSVLFAQPFQKGFLFRGHWNSGLCGKGLGGEPEQLFICATYSFLFVIGL